MTDRLLEKAQAAKSAEELLELAGEEGIELSAGQAEELFAKLNTPPVGELSDDDLDDVSGGGGNGGTSVSVSGYVLERKCPKCGNDCWRVGATHAIDFARTEYKCRCGVCAARAADQSQVPEFWESNRRRRTVAHHHAVDHHLRGGDVLQAE